MNEMKKYSSKYLLEDGSDDKLGEGAYGSVSKAKMIQNNNLKVCVKIMKKKKAYGENVLKTQQAPEFDICKRMRNKSYENLVKIFDVYDSDVEDENAYIFMERCEYSLTQYMKTQKGKITKELLLNIIKQIARGYVSLIKENIIHRDLKPENILCNQIKDQLQIKIADFGLSKVIDSDSEQCNTKKVGTPYYTAPEILDVKNKQAYDNRCDIFSLGIILLDLASESKQFKCKEIEKLKDSSFLVQYSDLIKIKKIDQEIADLLNKMIVYEFKKRLTWEQLIQYFDDTKTNEKQLSGLPNQPIIQPPQPQPTQFPQSTQTPNKLAISWIQPPQFIQPVGKTLELPKTLDPSPNFPKQINTPTINGIQKNDNFLAIPNQPNVVQPQIQGFSSQGFSQSPSNGQRFNTIAKQQQTFQYQASQYQFQQQQQQQKFPFQPNQNFGQTFKPNFTQQNTQFQPFPGSQAQATKFQSNTQHNQSK